jgi:uncharacterized protein
VKATKGWGIVAFTGASGTVLLRRAFAAQPGSSRFHALALATAGAWTAGALASGYPLRDGRDAGGVSSVSVGVVAFAGFCAAAPIARRIPPLRRAIDGALRHAEASPGPLVLATTCANAIGEELFFRGALYAAFSPRHPVAGSAIAYTAVTAATRNPALALAGAAMGLLFARQRRTSGGVRASALTHVTWSLLMVRYLPRKLSGLGRSTDRDGRRRSAAIVQA